MQTKNITTTEISERGDEIRQLIGAALMSIAQERGIDPGWIYGEALVHSAVVLTAVGKEREARRLFDIARNGGRVIRESGADEADCCFVA